MNTWPESAAGFRRAVAAAVTAWAALSAAEPSWVAYPEGGGIVARYFDRDGLGTPAFVSRQGAACFPPGLSIGSDGLPVAAWLGTEGGLWASGYDGRRWSVPELVSPSRGVHRGPPSLAAGGGVAVDIKYAVRAKGRWSEPRAVHEPNDVPDIMPSVSAGPSGTFSISWKSMEDGLYVERRAGTAPAAGDRGEIPDGLCEVAFREGLPPQAVLAWTATDGLPRSLCLKEAEDERARADERGEEKRTSPRAAGAATIVAFGDSITYGRGSSSNGPRTGYPLYLQAVLRYNYPATSFTVANEGNPGERTEGGVGRIDDAIAQHRPQYILIMEGTNDIFFGVSFETIQENLKQMAFRAAARGVIPILATIIPTDPHVRPDQYARTRSFYTGGYVQALYRRYSIPYADQWQAFCSVPSFAETLIDTATGNHPNDNGYRYVMAPEWYETLAPYLDLPFTPAGPTLALDESAERLARGGREEFGYALEPSNDMVRNAVDCYAALRSPDGALFFFDSRRRLTRSATPLARKILLSRLPHAGHLLGLSIDPAATPGTYTLYLVTVRALREPLNADNWTSNLAQIRFEVE